MSKTDIVSKMQDSVLILTLDGPKSRNAISPPVYAILQQRFIDAGEDPNIRAIVLHGANGFFSSGGDVNNLRKSATLPLSEVTKNTDGLNSMIRVIRACPKPVIAAVEGGTAGAGVSLALACDFLVAGEGAKFIAAYVKIGLTPDGGITHFLTASLPRQMVSEMCMMGKPIDAQTLHQHGVVNNVTAPDKVLEGALDMARALARGPQMAMAKIKSLIAAAPGNDLATHLEAEADAINRARYTAESREGTAAFLDKRKPKF